MSHKIDVHLLSCLVALVTEEHVTRAADRMNMSQPAMSNALGRLRDLFGDPLLIRTSNGMIPTDRANELVSELQPALRVIDSMLTSSGPFDPASSNAHFNIMTTDYGALVLLPKLMQLLTTVAPNVSIGMRYARPTELHAALESGECSLVVGFYSGLPEGLFSSAIDSDRIVCISQRHHPRVPDSLSLETYVDGRHAYFAGTDERNVSTVEKLIDKTLDESGFRRSIALRLSSVNVLPHIVAESELFAVMPQKSVDRLVKDLPVDVHPLPFEFPEFKSALLWHERTHRDPAHKWLRETIRSAAKLT